MLVRMERGGKAADVHPEMVPEYERVGYTQYAPDLPSLEDIAKMKKGDVIEWLAAHGVEGASGTVGKLREALKKAMYLDGS